MTSILKKMGIIAIVMTAAASATVPAAFAGSFSGGVVEQVQYHPHASRTCASSTALRRARDMGLRNVRITRRDSRRVVVEGLDRRSRWQWITFANTSGCPLIRR